MCNVGLLTISRAHYVLLTILVLSVSMYADSQYLLAVFSATYTITSVITGGRMKVGWNLLLLLLI